MLKALPLAMRTVRDHWASRWNPLGSHGARSPAGTDQGRCYPRGSKYLNNKYLAQIV